jgi:hypothetical protein
MLFRSYFLIKILVAALSATDFYVNCTLHPFYLLPPFLNIRCFVGSRTEVRAPTIVSDNLARHVAEVRAPTIVVITDSQCYSSV